MTAPTRPRYIDGQRIDTISIYAHEPVTRYRVRLDDGRVVIRTGEQIDADNPEPLLSAEEYEWSDLGRGRCGLLHLALGAVAFVCVVGIGVLYAFRVGVWG